MPQLGESVAEGTIGKWLKKPGDAVAKYEPLLEVITDKVNAEVPSPFAGVLREILVEEGATVPNNAEIAVIETEEEAAGQAGAAPLATSGKAPLAEPDTARPASEVRAPSMATPGGAKGPAGSDERGTKEATERSDRPERAAASAMPSAPTATQPSSAA